MLRNLLTTSSIWLVKGMRAADRPCSRSGDATSIFKPVEVPVRENYRPTISARAAWQEPASIISLVLGFFPVASTFTISYEASTLWSYCDQASSYLLADPTIIGTVALAGCASASSSLIIPRILSLPAVVLQTAFSFFTSL